MSQDLQDAPVEGLTRIRYARVPGTRLLGRYEGSGYRDERFLVMRPDGQTVMLTQLLYLVVRYADGHLDGEQVAGLVSEDYGRRLPLELLDQLVTTRLAPAGLMLDPTGCARSRPAPRSDPLLAITLDRALLPTRAVRAVARVLAPLFIPAVVAVVLIAFAGSEYYLLSTRGPGSPGASTLHGPGDLLALLLLLGASTVVHEFGHAAGCRYGGGRPGSIGAAVYLWLPVFWTEVTDAYRLDRAGRLRTDLGGIYFNAVFVVIATSGFALTGWAPLAAVALLNNLVIVQQLIPFVRLDGYYLLGDLTGVPNLFALAGPILRGVLPGRAADPRVGALRRRTRIIVTAWVLLTAVALTGTLLLLAFTAPTLVSSAWAQLRNLWTAATDPRSAAGMILGWICMGILVLPFVGITALILRVVRRLAGLVRDRGPGRPHGTEPQPAARPARVKEAAMDNVAATSASAAGRIGPQPGPEGQPGAAGAADRPPGAAPRNGSTAAAPAAADATPPPASAGPGRAAADPPGSGGRRINGWLRPAQPPPVVPPLPDDPLSAESFTEEVMLRHRRRAPEGGWRRRVFVATGGYVDPGPSAAQRRQAELIERVRRPVRDCRRIVVLSRKGGAGKTTTTLMLGHTLAMHRGDRVVALDANPDAGSLPYRVARQNRATLTTLLADVDSMASYADVRAHTSQAASRLEVVASDDDPRISQGMGQADYHRAIELLDRHYMLVLMDTGTGILDDAIQGILREADQVVVVMPPALDGARVAASTLDWLDRHGMSGLVKGAVAVLNGVRSEGGLVQLDEIERHFRARCAAVVRIPWDRALEAGARTALEDLRPATREAYLEMAAAVADGFALPGRRS